MMFNMKPWESNDNKDWLDLLPKDFYFALECQNDLKYTIVYIVPVEYYDAHGYMYEHSFPITNILPIYLEEILEGVYETDLSFNFVKKDLVGKGFIHNSYFQAHIENINPMANMSLL